jgi:hypothetical protein
MEFAVTEAFRFLRRHFIPKVPLRQLQFAKRVDEEIGTAKLSVGSGTR